MDFDIPRPEDHLGLLIYVKLCQSSSSNASVQVSYNRVFERLRRIGGVNVSENPPRSVVPNFVSSLADCKTSWGEFQQHRKAIGLICVGFLDDAQTNGIYECNGNGQQSQRGHEIASSKIVASTVSQQYHAAKEQYRATLVDARCVVFGNSSADDGTNQPSSSSSSTAVDGVLRYPSLEDATALEHDVRDYVKALYWVLEGKRLDLSFEKQDAPPFPVVPDEDKYLVGLDRTSRAFRKRAIGRLRKQVADVTLMTGLPTLAVESYNAAIDQLKSANDWLWLAGAYEGYACAALVAKYGESALDLLANSTSTSSSTLQRVPTFTPGEMKRAQHNRQASPHSGALAPRRAGGISMRSDSPRHAATRLLISEADIEEKFRLAIENYQKFSFAASIEMDCAFKATSVYLLERRYDALDEFINVHCARFLDENFTVFADAQKSYICNLISTVYKAIGFRRKMAFFTRLSALFRLYLSRGEDPVSLTDYRQVYPLFLESLDGCHIPWSGVGGPTTASGGWPAVQVRALHETYLSALRGNYRDAAARHLTHMIQVALDNPGSTSVDVLSQFCTELVQLNSQNGVHNISSHLRLGYGAILPPVQLTLLPKILSVDIKSLPAHLNPYEVPDSTAKAIFIYSPFQTGLQNTQVRWVRGCPSAVLITMQNLLPFELTVKNLVLIGDGATFDSSPVSVVLSPKINSLAFELFLTPMESGSVTLTGCSCEIFGVKNTCRFEDVRWLKRNPRSLVVEVLDTLPELELESSLRRAEGHNRSELTEIYSAEATLYAGQKQSETVRLLNVSDVPIERLEWEIQQPTGFGVSSMINVHENPGDFELPFLSRTVREIGICITAVDPVGTEGDIDDHSKRLAGPASSTAFIPYTGRVLTATIKFMYCGSVKEDHSTFGSCKMYQRCCAITVFVTVLPVVVVVDWHVLPGETSNDRYIALDVLNTTDGEVDVGFPVDKAVVVQPKDVCRVPLFCECCDLTSVTSSQLLRGPRAKHYFMDARRKFVQEHVRSRLKVTWRMTSNKDVYGDVPIATVLNSERLRKELVMPLLTLNITVVGAVGGTNDEYVAGVAECISLRATVVPAKGRGRAVAALGLSFFQDYLNGLTSPVVNDVLIIGSATHLVHLGGDASTCDQAFQFLFCNEGVYKVTIACDITQKTSSAPSLANLDEDVEDDLCGVPIMPVLTFNVVSRCDSNVP